jgi:ABC-type nickel/cobalt efflux system permease component RcnA
MTRGQANLLRAFSIWTVYVWVTRLWNIWGDDQGIGFKLVHTVLAVVSVAFAVACWVVVSRVRRRRLAAAQPAVTSESDRTPVA